MTYSNKKIPNDPNAFPPVQEWMTWIEVREWHWNSATRSYSHGGPSNEGKLRHHYTIADVKRSLRWIGAKSKYKQNPGIFSADWAVYQWDFAQAQWVLRYSGLAGEARDDNPFFKRRLTKGEKRHPIDGAQEEAAIRSILQAVR